MKAEVSQQRLLLEVAEVDAALTRLTHRSTHLVEQQRFDDVLRCPECGAILVRVKDFRAGETGL